MMDRVQPTVHTQWARGTFATLAFLNLDTVPTFTFSFPSLGTTLTWRSSDGLCSNVTSVAMRDGIEAELGHYDELVPAPFRTDTV